MEFPPDSTLNKQIKAFLRQGDLRLARKLAYHWLDNWNASRLQISSSGSLRNPLLWESLADVVEHTHDDYLAERFWQCLDGIAPAGTGLASIPVLGIPIVNRLDLLLQLLASIDFPVGTLAIVDNSAMEGGHADLTAQLAALQRSTQPNIGQIKIARPFGNIGVAASWNLILTSFPEASSVMLANNDIVFAPGVLKASVTSLNPAHPEFLPLLPEPHGFSAFLITAKAWDRIVLFDTSFYPAYCEDLDYRDRLRADPDVRIIEIAELQDAMASLNQQHSATIASDPQLAEQNRSSFQLNRLWYFSQRRLRNDPRGSWMRRWLGSWDH